MSATRNIIAEGLNQRRGRIARKILAVFCAGCLAPAISGAEAAPVVSATLNGSLDATLFQGQPAIFEVQLTHPNLWDDTLQPIRLEQANGASWTNALTWNITGPAGVVAWPIWMRPVTSKVITMDGDIIGRVFFLLSPTDTLAIAPGSYSVDFILDTRPGAVAGAWTGVARSIRMEVAVETPAANLTSAQFARQQGLLAQYQMLRNDAVAGLAALDALLLAQPRSLEGLRTKAIILETNGNIDEAAALADQALGVFAEDFPNAPEPPRDLARLRQELTGMMANVLQVTSATIDNGKLSIVWPSETGKQYRIESSVDFRVWRFDATGLSGAGGTATWSGNLDGGARFFRIAVE